MCGQVLKVEYSETFHFMTVFQFQIYKLWKTCSILEIFVTIFFPWFPNFRILKFTRIDPASTPRNDMKFCEAKNWDFCPSSRKYIYIVVICWIFTPKFFLITFLKHIFQRKRLNTFFQFLIIYWRQNSELWFMVQLCQSCGNSTLLFHLDIAK